MADLLSIAVQNNIHLCRAVMAPFGITATTSDSCTIFHGPPRPYYPSVITRSADVTDSDMSMMANLPQGAGVKDSFASLKLAPLGFKSVIRAEWFGATFTAPAPPVDAVTAATLPDWVRAWGEDPVGRSNFTKDLLGNPDIKLWMTPDGMSGGLTNRSAPDVVGLSNVFGPPERIVTTLSGTIVGYDSAPAPYTKIGFATLGPLAIWIKTG